jgi:hypothetical protein
MKEVLLEIKKRIENFGYHHYIVQQGKLPRQSYTIGLNEQLKFELVTGGLAYFENEQDLEIIFENIINALLKD